MLLNLLKRKKFFIIFGLVMTNTLVNGSLISTVSKSRGVGNKLSNPSDFVSPFNNGDTIDIANSYDFIIADIDGAIIQGIRTNNTFDGRMLKVSENLSCGSCSGNHTTSIVFYDQPKELILTGTAGCNNDPPINYYNFTNFDFANLSATITINAPIEFNVAVVNCDNATLNIGNNVTTQMPSVLTINTINIAEGKSFTIDAVNNDIVLLDNNSSINFGINASLILTNSGTSNNIFTAYNVLTGNVLFSSNGSLIANGGITGNVDFAGNNGVLQLADGQTITGNVDSSSSSAGTLEFLGAGTVTGNIGSTNPLSAINFNGSGAINLQSTSNAATFTVGNSGASVTASNLMSGTLNYAAAGTVNANGGITGNIDFAGNNGVLQLADGQTITGNVDSSSSSAGTLEFLGAGTVTGNIGSTNPLSAINFNGSGAINVPLRG